MTLKELAYKEDNLYSKVVDLYHKPQTDEANNKLREIFIEYKEIHKTYAKLSSYDLEALKRGLFIQWYPLTEPSYLTGIADLDENAQTEILHLLNKAIKADKLDNELVWMVNYYSNWAWVFERVKSFNGFDPKIVNEKNNQLPIAIDKEKMQIRGQMGKYWNSLTRFNTI